MLWIGMIPFVGVSKSIGSLDLLTNLGGSSELLLTFQVFLVWDGDFQFDGEVVKSNLYVFRKNDTSMVYSAWSLATRKICVGTVVYPLIFHGIYLSVKGQLKQGLGYLSLFWLEDPFSGSNSLRHHGTNLVANDVEGDSPCYTGDISSAKMILCVNLGIERSNVKDDENGKEVVLLHTARVTNEVEADGSKVFDGLTARGFNSSFGILMNQRSVLYFVKLRDEEHVFVLMLQRGRAFKAQSVYPSVKKRDFPFEDLMFQSMSLILVNRGDNSWFQELSCFGFKGANVWSTPGNPIHCEVLLGIEKVRNAQHLNDKGVCCGLKPKFVKQVQTEVTVEFNFDGQKVLSAIYEDCVGDVGLLVDTNGIALVSINRNLNESKCPPWWNLYNGKMCCLVDTNRIVSFRGLCALDGKLRKKHLFRILECEPGGSIYYMMY